MASMIDLDRVRRNDDRLSTLQLILSGAVDLDALKEVLRVNTKVSEVIIYVDESFLVELPVEDTHDLFRTIGGMPNLQKLGFHSQSGSSGVLSIQALIAITSHATRMVHFGISDVALWGSQADFQLWATQLQTQLFLQSFCVCECELLEPSKECPLDPLLTVLSILPSLEALFLQAATPNALGQVSPEAVGSIGMAPQLQDLRLGNFELKHKHMEQMAQVLPHNTVLTELKLDACHEFHVDTARSLAKILRHNRRLKSMELGFTQMMNDDCAVILAKSLHYNSNLESFTLSRGAGARFRPTISKVCQAAFVEMLHQNYCLETLVLFQRFPVKKEFKLYLTLNKYGRGKLLMNHSTQKENWIQAIHKVNDDLDSIFYYVSINPALCNNCFDEEEEEQEEEEEELATQEEQEEEEEIVSQEVSNLTSLVTSNNLLFQSMSPNMNHKRRRPESSGYMEEYCYSMNATEQQQQQQDNSKRIRLVGPATGGINLSSSPVLRTQQHQSQAAVIQAHHHMGIPSGLSAMANLRMPPQFAMQAMPVQYQHAIPPPRAAIHHHHQATLQQAAAAAMAAQIAHQQSIQDPPGSFWMRAPSSFPFGSM